MFQSVIFFLNDFLTTLKGVSNLEYALENRTHAGIVLISISCFDTQ